MDPAPLGFVSGFMRTPKARLNANFERETATAEKPGKHMQLQNMHLAQLRRAGIIARRSKQRSPTLFDP
jgi:hypothetical protein